MRLILASGSEWRKKLLEWLEVPFEVVVSDVDESVVEEKEPSKLVERLAVMKTTLGNGSVKSVTLFIHP